MQRDTAETVRGTHCRRRRDTRRARGAGQYLRTLVAGPVEGDHGVSVGGERLQFRVDVAADLGAERIQRYQRPVGAFGTQQDKTVKPGEITTV